MKVFYSTLSLSDLGGRMSKPFAWATLVVLNQFTY